MSSNASRLFEMPVVCNYPHHGPEHLTIRIEFSSKLGMVSHGICPHCKEVEMAELRKMLTNQESPAMVAAA